MPSNGPSLIAFFVFAAITLASAIGAMSLRNLVHCGLSLALCFAGLAAMYLQLNAEFVGFAQILVYVGAVAILIVFTILLTRNADVHMSRASRGWLSGLAIAFAVCAAIAVPILKSPSLNRTAPAIPEHSVQKIGEQLMTTYVLPLEAIALLLTAAMLGGVVIAMRDEPVDKVGRGVLTAPRRESELHMESSRVSPRRAEDSAPCHEAPRPETSSAP
jgi:NADH-quinone oxidoreductase subunit J